jgi:hypothetical protein
MNNPYKLPVIRESAVERRAVIAAREQGWLSYKFASPACRGVPDRIFIRDGTVLFVEFKSLGGRLSPSQKVEIARIAQHGGMVHVANSLEVFMDIINGIPAPKG